MVKALAERGDRVFVVRTKAGSRSGVDEISGGRGCYDHRGCRRWQDALARYWQHRRSGQTIDCLINNSGIFGDMASQSLDSITMDLMRQLFNVNNLR